MNDDLKGLWMNALQESGAGRNEVIPPLGNLWLKGNEMEADVDEVRKVCAEAYQVVGSLLVDLGQFNTDRATKILDNLSEQRLVHDDVLPWPSLQNPELAGALASLRHLYANLMGGAVRDEVAAKGIAKNLLGPVIEKLEGSNMEAMTKQEPLPFDLKLFAAWASAYAEKHGRVPTAFDVWKAMQPRIDSTILATVTSSGGAS